MGYHGFYCAILAEGLEHLQTSVGVRDQWLCVDTERSSWASSHLSWTSLCLSAHIGGCVERGRGSAGSRLIQLSLACCHLLCQDSLRVSTGRQEGPEGTEAWQALWRPEPGAATMSFCPTANKYTSGDWLQCGGRRPPHREVLGRTWFQRGESGWPVQEVCLSEEAAVTKTSP